MSSPKQPYFKQFYLGCLAHASYLIGSKGEAAVVDPQRDVEIYLEEAERNGLKIKYVLETHLHADFVSGHRELAARTGARIYFGQRAGAAFEHVGVKDGDEIRVGELRLRFWETPGHTPESICILVFESQNAENPRKVLTGDTLFIGDVGRPDLVGAKGFSSEEMARMLYQSLHGKLLKLPDHVEVYPAHGAGSACGRNISMETSSTIGVQRRLNYALQPMSEAKFLSLILTDLPAPPNYFSFDAELNRKGPATLDELGMPPALPPSEVLKKVNEGAILLDVRDRNAYWAGHIPGSIHIELTGQFAPWAGSLLKPASSILLAADGLEAVREARTRLARVGLENVVGYLEGGIQFGSDAELETEVLPQIGITELQGELKKGALLLDVRRPQEYSEGHIPGALSFPLADFSRPVFSKKVEELDRTQPLAVTCATGYRSSIACSLLRREGFKNLYNVAGGTSAWIAAGQPISKHSL